MTESIYRLRQQDILAVCVLALLGLGVLMVQSASMTVAAPASKVGAPVSTGDASDTSGKLPAWRWSSPGQKHLGFAVVSAAVFFAVGMTDFSKLVRAGAGPLRNPSAWLLAVAGICCLAVLVPHIGIQVNGARRWLPMGFTRVQPSEMAKWAVVLFLAYWLSSRPIDLSRFRAFLLTLVPVVALCLLVVIQDFGTAALIAVCALTLLIAGRIKLWHLAVVIPPALCAAAWFVMHKEYRWRRMTAFVNPYAAPQGEGYHMIQSLLSFSTGGVLGKGLGNGVQKLGYLPEDTTDFIFAVICEELGLFGAIFVTAMYAGILYVAWQAMKQKVGAFGRLLALGIGSMIGLQAAINMAVATVSVPTKGLSLPLISAGGSGLVITCAALGLLYSVARRGQQARDAETTPAIQNNAATPAGLPA